ncbi:MAG: haloalkane dehalogenase [Pseudomonadota bacterium]
MKRHLAEACFVTPEIMKTASGISYIRTPDACFEALPDWDYTPRFVEINGLRQGYIEVGPESGKIILMLHGQPSWSYLYRFMIRDLSNKGYRVIAMDHLGFGLSDKPINVDDHSFETHASRLVKFMNALDLQNINLFAQDWGSIIGLYTVADHADRFSRVIIGNGGLPIVKDVARNPDNIEKSNRSFGRMINMMPANQPALFDDEGNPLLTVGDGQSSDPFGEWVAFARYSQSFQPSLMIEALTYEALTPQERAAYDAPFPHEMMMAGPRSFPGLRNELVGITQSRKDKLEKFDRPFLTIFGANDPGLVGEGDGQPWMMNNIPGAKNQPHQRIREASHFLQDDIGLQIAEMVDEFISK